MIYRAELLYAAKGDANKIFSNMAKYIFDYSEFDRVQKMGHFESPSNDDKFITQRFHLVKRLLSQINNFLSQYKIFNNQFLFKQVNIYEYLSSELEKVKAVKNLYDQYKNKEILGVSENKDVKTKKVINPHKIKKVSRYVLPTFKPETEKASSRKS